MLSSSFEAFCVGDKKTDYPATKELQGYKPTGILWDFMEPSTTASEQANRHGKQSMVCLQKLRRHLDGTKRCGHHVAPSFSELHQQRRAKRQGSNTQCPHGSLRRPLTGASSDDEDDTRIPKRDATGRSSGPPTLGFDALVLVLVLVLE